MNSQPVFLEAKNTLNHRKLSHPSQGKRSILCNNKHCFGSFLCFVLCTGRTLLLLLVRLASKQDPTPMGISLVFRLFAYNNFLREENLKRDPQFIVLLCAPLCKLCVYGYFKRSRCSYPMRAVLLYSYPFLTSREFSNQKFMVLSSSSSIRVK